VRFAFNCAVAAIAIAVYVDARHRRSRSPFLWGAGSFLLCAVIAPIWYAVRPLRAGEARTGGRVHNAVNAFGVLWMVLLMLAAAVEFIRRVSLVATGERGVLRTFFSLWHLGNTAWLVLGISGFVFLLLSTWTNKKGVIEYGPTGSLASQQQTKERRLRTLLNEAATLRAELETEATG